MWRLYGADGDDKDYEIFSIPFISVTDMILKKIRNLTYRYLPNQMSLFTQETEQYDSWLLRELLNNAICHANHQIGGRIYINEFEDRIIISNPGNFLPKTVEAVLKPGYNPPFYRNQLLADSMANFRMIDTATSGIRKVYRIQKAKYFPMPDYDLARSEQVSVTVYGKILDDKYMHILYEHQDLDLQTVFLLDRVQKGLPIDKKDADKLRSYQLVEGRLTSLYLSAEAAQSINDSASYIKNKGFADKYYKDLIIAYIQKYGRAQKKDIRNLLWDKLPDALSDKQKEDKIHNLLSSLRMNGTIAKDSPNPQKSSWVLL